MSGTVPEWISPSSSRSHLTKIFAMIGNPFSPLDSDVVDERRHPTLVFLFLATLLIPFDDGSPGAERSC
jgi:hypothetical protein